ncbi:MAG: hypothetical protein RIM99_17515 [Cyclobacteriaceae bacterium]
MKSFTLFLLSSALILNSLAQETLSVNHLEQAAIRFTLNENHEMDQETKNQLSELIGDDQFVGIAEVHQSQQLSYFTTGFLALLNEKGFNHFALELGPNSAEVLQEISINSGEAGSKIRELNRRYGKNSFSKTPLIFADKVEDALFIDKAARLGYTFWGLDQEFAFSYEMHLDNIYKLEPNPDPQLTALYNECRSLIRKHIFKNKISGTGKNCWMMQNQKLDEFFNRFQGNEKAERIIQGLKATWDIYCRYETNRPSNQVRANYMKSNFDSLYTLSQKTESTPKVLVKLGGVHLTHGLSPFRVDDVGKYLHEKSMKLNTGFFSIRHLITYKNGKSNIGKSGWKEVTMFLELGQKDQWTMVDLRPFRQRVLSGELVTNDKYIHELTSYDLLLIPPDDKIGKINY